MEEIPVEFDSVTAAVELGERIIKSAITHASRSDIDSEFLWRDYLRVVLDRAERNCALHPGRDQESLPLRGVAS